MTKLESKYIIKWANKIRAINELGGKCTNCGMDNIFCMDFHHVEGKDFNISENSNKRWSTIESEINKCVLLCRNCHREFHSKNSRPDRIKRKNAWLNFLNIDGCSRCGYHTDILASIDFHHTGDKEFSLQYVITRPNIISAERVNDELNKCIVLCANCHSIEHCDIENFNKYKEQIYYKVNNYKEKQQKIDRTEVKKLLDSGMTQKNIASYFNASKSTISLIVKQFKLIGNPPHNIL